VVLIRTWPSQRWTRLRGTPASREPTPKAWRRPRGQAWRRVIPECCITLFMTLHAVVGINSVADLKGKRVSSGLPGTGTSIKALRVLDASGVTPESLQVDTHQDYPEAALALNEGKIDAFAWDATLPGQAILDLVAAPGIKIRLHSSGEVVPQMVAKYGPFYFAGPIPKGTYPGVDHDVLAAAGKTLFVTDDRLEESTAYEITRAVLENIPELSAALMAAIEMSPKNAVLGSSIPFHSGALRYYKEKGITVPLT
jgi:TRAP transporter TAXI family solute receptor